MLPPLYARWFDDLLGTTLHEESRATCDACPMTAPPEPTFGAAKCCTFMPDLPSFSVGALLMDDEPSVRHGRDKVAARIATGVGVSPYGVLKSRPYRLMYTPDAFGRSAALTCPYFVKDSGGCGVWRHRESICSTWFCRHERGMVGVELWRLVRRLIGTLEQDLARWVAIELGVPKEALDVLSKRQGDLGTPDREGWSDLDRVEDAEFYHGIWGDWDGREDVFYKACAERVQALSPEQVVDKGGALARLLLDDLKKANAEYADASPPDLVTIRRVERVRDNADDTVRIESYSPYDQLDLPAALVAKLSRGETDGLEPELRRKLVDFSVLSEVRSASKSDEGESK